MKLLKSILVLFIAISITSCSSDDDNFLELSEINIASSYNLTAYKSVEKESATSQSGVTSELSKTTIVGGTFTNAIVAFNANGTYSINGNFVLGYNTTPTPKDGQRDSEAISLSSNGTYKLDPISKTITITETTGLGYINGSFDIKSFNQNSLVLKQETNANEVFRVLL